MLFAVTNYAQTDVSDDQLALLCNAWDWWTKFVVCQEFSLYSWSYGVTFYKDPTKVPAGATLLRVSVVPPQKGLGGYHDEAGGRPYAEVFTRPTLGGPQPIAQGQYSLSTEATHEIVETVKNPLTALWVPRPLAVETYQSFDGADPVEDTYEDFTCGIPFSASNFVLGKYWDRQAQPLLTNPGPGGGRLRFDRLGVLTGAYSKTPGGYFVIRDKDGQRSVFGEKVPEWRKKHKAEHGRLAR